MKTVKCVALIVFAFCNLALRARSAPAFTTIRAAIAAAAPGDVIYVPAGTYQEQLELKRGIMLIGEGADSTIIDGAGSVNAVRGAKDSAIAGFTIRNSDFAFYAEGCFVGVFDCKLLDNDCGVGFNGGTGIVDGNVIAGEGKLGGIRSRRANPFVFNNIIADHRIGISLSDHYVSTVTSNFFVGNNIAIRIKEDAAAILEGNTFNDNKKEIVGQKLAETDVLATVDREPPSEIELPVRDAEVYRELMRNAFLITTAEHPSLVYNLQEQAQGRFECSAFYPWATFHVKVSAKDTVIEDFEAVDRLTEGFLKARYFEKNDWPSVKVKNPSLKDSETDRYLLDQVYVRPASYFENDVGQLVFDRLTTFTRIEIAVPAGHVPVSVNYPFDTDTVDGRVIVKIVDVGKTNLKVIMEEVGVED